ncbi:MAG: glycoside hydrolase family 5 protein [Solirubrobacterales bacterium]|nr:glycoside hydrolase family 5 protein [Solirubrobacterales bacterium]
MSFARALPVVLLAAALMPASASAGPVPAVRGIGISNVGADTPLTAIDAELTQAAALGARTVRAEISWAALEPSAQGERQADYLARLDRLVSGARRRHIKPLLLLLRTPCWASAAPGAPEACPSDFAEYPPRDPADYARIAAWLASRYKGRLAGLEVWNEPDHANEEYFKGPDKPARYAAILKAAERALDTADPSLPVIAGSLVGSNGKFLEALYAEGIQGHYDALAVHYYDLTLASLRAIRAVQLAHGDHRPVWVTEFGWTSCFPAATSEGEHKCVTRKQQARDLGDIFRALRGTSWVRAAIVYKLRDTATEHFGVLSSGGARKPAFATLRQAFRTGLGAPRAIQARVSGSRLTGSAPAGDIVTVQGFRADGSFFYQAIVAPDRSGHFAIDLPGDVLGNKLVVSQPWTKRSKTLRA